MVHLLVSYLPFFTEKIGNSFSDEKESYEQERGVRRNERNR